MKIVSWNVNGLRACERHGFVAWLADANPDVICLQEVRAELPQLSDACRLPAGYAHTFWNPAAKKGYSGVATWAKTRPSSVAYGLGQADFDGEGRVIVTEHEGFALYNIYFPNGGRDHSRVPFKLAFYEHLMQQVAARVAAGDRILIGGDFNTAHGEIDLANPQANRTTTGFLPEERAVLTRLLALGFRDVFRDRHPGEAGHYTWWSNRPGVRERNVGWRIDYFLASENLAPRVRHVEHLHQVRGSDHCPVLVDLAEA